MNTNLFNDLYLVIQKNFTKDKIRLKEFFEFLTSGLIRNHESQKFISGQQDLNTVIGTTYRRIVANSQLLQLKDLCNVIYPDNASTKDAQLYALENLYQKHHIQKPDTKVISILLSKLFVACLAEETEQLFLSQQKQQLKPATVRTTLGRETDSKNLYKELNEHHKIIITGELGTGKTHFIEYCLSTWNLSDYYYISYTDNLVTTLQSIKYQYGPAILADSHSIEILKQTKFSSALLIIDHMYSSNNYLEELKQLSDLAVSVIIITNNTTVPSSFRRFELTQLSENYLYSIFKNISGLILKDCHLKKQLHDIGQNNILMYSLIAAHCKHIAKKNTLYSSDDIVKQILSRLNTLDNHIGLKEDINYKFKHRYDQKSMDLIGHIKLVYKGLLQHQKPLHNLMMSLCCFGWTPIPLSFLEKVIPSYDFQKLCNLADMHLITLTYESVKLSPLISHAVVASANPAKTKFIELISSLTDFLYKQEQTLAVPYLSNILLTFAQTLYNDVLIKHNPEQHTTSDYFENWQTLIYGIYNYYNQNGAYYYAKEVIQLIKYPKALDNKHSQFDPLFFCTANNMHLETEHNKFITWIDSICNVIKGKTNDNLQSIDMINLIENTLDSIVDRFCYFALADNEDKDKIVAYHSNLLLAIKKLLGYISLPFSKTSIKLNLPKEKIHYYCGCQWLMEEPLSFEDYIHTLYELKAYDNINIHIKGVAFTIFQMSSYMQDAGYRGLLDYSAYRYFLVPAVSELNELIKCCKFIPLPTFRLCLYAYINASITQYTYINAFPNNAHLIRILINSENMHNLFSRSLLDKETLEDATNRLKTIYQKIETKLTEIQHTKR